MYSDSTSTGMSAVVRHAGDGERVEGDQTAEDGAHGLSTSAQVSNSPSQLRWRRCLGR